MDTKVMNYAETSEVDLVEKIRQVQQSLSQVWLGDSFILDLMLVAVLARGHLLLEDVPGVGKTTLAKIHQRYFARRYSWRQYL